MEDNPPRVSRSSEAGANGPITRRRFAAVDDGGGDLIECSGKFCKSCTAGLIADCVALCCCPCAVVHCFALAFVKAPWVVGRRCLGLGNKNKKRNKKHKCHLKSKSSCVVDDLNVMQEHDFNVGWPQNLVSGFGGVVTSAASSSVGEIDNVSVNDGFEAEKVWLELYRIDHLDFGRRVSLSND